MGNTTEETTLYCANHPQVETLLRCNRCGKPICLKCAVHTPVGYRCKSCLQGQQEVFYTATRSHQAAGSVVAVVLGLLVGVAAYFVGQLSWISLFIAPVVGGLVGEAIFRASGRKRARRFHWIGGGLVASGALLTFLLAYLFRILSFGYFDLWLLLWGLVFVVLVTGTVYGRLK
ncbi:MAG: hypothetical protein H8D78_09345 [Chloroflexi bacterium]|nr:hypothetical protein [Chloroflexota bacterium]